MLLTLTLHSLETSPVPIHMLKSAKACQYVFAIAREGVLQWVVREGAHMLSIFHYYSDDSANWDVLRAICRQNLRYKSLVLCLPIHGGLRSQPR